MNGKKVLYWALFPLTICLLFVSTTIYALGSYLSQVLHLYEAWTFEYERNGWRYLGDGIWIGASDLDQSGDQLEQQ